MRCRCFDRDELSPLTSQVSFQGAGVLVSKPTAGGPRKFKRRSLFEAVVRGDDALWKVLKVELQPGFGRRSLFSRTDCTIARGK